MAMFALYLLLVFASLTNSCDVFVGMTCVCYDSSDIRCTMSKFAPLAFTSPSIPLTKSFRSIDLTFDCEEHIQLEKNYFLLLNQLFPNTTPRSLSLTLRFQIFRSFLAKSSSFSSLFNGITTPQKRLTIELHPVKAKTITFERNSFDNLHVNELSVYGESLSSPFESIFNNANITSLNIDGAIVTHDPSLLKDYTGHIQSLKITRMIDTVNSEEFPPFPVQSYTIEAHKMRTLDASSFVDYTNLVGINIIQPDVSITPKILNGLEKIPSLKSMSFDAERIADGALKHVKQIHTLILGEHIKILDNESLNALKALEQLDVRYVQFTTLQQSTSCSLADYINRRRMQGLTVYLPSENPDCNCLLVFLNNMVDDGSQLTKCQSANNDLCLFYSCPIVSEYFTRKQKEDLEEQQKQVNTPPTQSSSSVLPFQPSSVDFNDEEDSPSYPDGNMVEQEIIDEDQQQPKPTDSILYPMYDDGEGTTKNPKMIPSTRPYSSYLVDSNDFSTSVMGRVHPNSKENQSKKYLVLSWIPFAIIALCLLLSLITAMLGYIFYHRRRTTSFKLVPQSVPII